MHHQTQQTRRGGFRATFKTHEKMTINTYNSNIEIKFNDERETINLYADEYLNVSEKFTADEEKEGLQYCFDLDENEVDEIIETLLTLEWIEK